MPRATFFVKYIITAKGGDVIAEACDQRRLSGPHAKAERDWCDAEGALNLAEKIERFWLDRGKIVACRVEASGFIGIQAIRSDMVDGRPR